jgi:hypothetical protein
MTWVAAVLAVAVCAVALRVATSSALSAPSAPTTFANAGIGCAPSPSATEQVFLRVDATDKEIIVARLAIASIPGVTIDQYIDHRGALTQLSCIFSDSPGALHGIRPIDLPVSFAITSNDSDTASAARLRAIPKVLGVVTPATWSAFVQRIDE